MNKNTKKILALGVLSLFMFAFVMTLVVAAAPETAAVTGNAVTDPIKNLFTKWEGGDLSTNVAKYLFFALIAIIIYSISSVMPFLSNQKEWIKWPFALVVSFLATAFITPEEVYMMLISYGAMGLIMSAVIPFIILFFFTIEIEKKDPKLGSYLTPIVWIGFVVFMAYKLIAGWANETSPLSGWEFWLYIIAIVAAVIFILTKDKILDKMYKKGIEEGIRGKEMAQDATLAARITEKKRLLAELISDGKGTKSHAYLTLKGEIEGLEKHLESD